MHTASMKATIVVPRMKPSIARNARRAMTSNVPPEPRGASEWSAATARSESRRKKNMSRIASVPVAAISTITLTPLSRPDTAVPPNFDSSGSARPPPTYFCTRSIFDAGT